MKKRNYLEALLLLLTCYFIACSHQSQTDRPDGWYYLTEGTPDTLSKDPIVTVRDFEELRLDSIQIAGKLNEQSIAKWSDATENSIGKQIAFVYNNKVICAPRVNARIESGHFAISIHPALHGQYDIRQLYEDLRGEMTATDHPASL